MRVTFWLDSNDFELNPQDAPKPPKAYASMCRPFEIEDDGLPIAGRDSDTLCPMHLIPLRRECDEVWDAESWWYEPTGQEVCPVRHCSYEIDWTRVNRQEEMAYA